VQADQKTFRDFLYFWVGQLVSIFGSSVSQFVIVWWITLETQSALYLSLASFLGFAPTVVLSMFAGVLADRWSRKALIAVTDLLQALATVVLIVMFWWGGVSIWQVLVVLTFRGVMQAFHHPASSAITPLMVPREKLSRMNGLNYLVNGAVTMVGPIVAAILLQVWAIHQILWVDAVTFLIAAVPLVAIVIPSVRLKQEKSSFREDFVEGLAFVKGTRGFLTLLVLATGLNFLLTPLSTLLPYFVKFDHFGDAPQLAFVGAFFQGGILAGGLLMSVFRGFKNRMVAIMLSIYVVFVGYALVALTPTGLFWFMAFGSIVMTVCLPIANVSIQTIVQTLVPLKMQGRVGSVIGAIASAATPVGMIIAGPLAAFAGASTLFLSCAVLGVALLTVSWFFTDVRHVEKLSAPVDQGLATLTGAVDPVESEQPRPT
jgi:DHA3 family macrolide efflux protein-like MFS transporter